MNDIEAVQYTLRRAVGYLNMQLEDTVATCTVIFYETCRLRVHVSRGIPFEGNIPLKDFFRFKYYPPTVGLEPVEDEMDIDWPSDFHMRLRALCIKLHQEVNDTLF